MYNTTQLAKEKKNPYKSRDHFLSDREYGRYVKTVLQSGMKVRARETYESVSMGDFGVYLQTNDGTPPAQVTLEGWGTPTGCTSIRWTYCPQRTRRKQLTPVSGAFVCVGSGAV